MGKKMRNVAKRIQLANVCGDPAVSLRRIFEMSHADRMRAKEQFEKLFGDLRVPTIAYKGEIFPAANYSAGTVAWTRKQRRSA